MYLYQRLLEGGYEVDIAAPSKKKLQFVVHDFVDGFDTYTEKLGYTLDAALVVADVDPSDYVALVVPGDRAPEYIRNDADCQRIVQQFFSDEKPVAELCHPPLVLGAAGVFQGRRTDAYPARAGHRGLRRHLRGRRRRRRRPDGVGARPEGPSRLDARVHAPPEGRAPAEGAEHAASVS
jgi:putative intracellular protease/amidase